jgi:rhamnosyltransferase
MQINFKTDAIAVVVWYNPKQEHMNNILSYIDAVSKVVIIDNSSVDNSHFLSNIDTITYIPLLKNQGIATALNIGCKEAIKLQAKWILTMDQDSCWEQEQLNKYFEYINQFTPVADVGVFSPRQNYNGHYVHYQNHYEDKIAVMTSGCLISSTGFERTNGFRDDFFIDEVDNEYCMHIRQLGMRVVIINNANLVHQLGELRRVKLFGIFKKEFIDHEPFRYYYMVRNNLVLSQMYPIYEKFNRHRLIKLIKRILFYDKVHKLQAIKMCLKGWRDFRKGTMGKLQ